MLATDRQSLLYTTGNGAFGRAAHIADRHRHAAISGRDGVAVYLARLKGLDKTTAEQRLHQWFDRLEINDWWNRRVEELSKGMQQKVQFVVTVLHNPQLLIFDEPFSGFDPVNADLLKREILNLKQQGSTIIFSTHNMPSAEELCDDIALINHAHVVLSGPLADIKAQNPGKDLDRIFIDTVK